MFKELFLDDDEYTTISARISKLELKPKGLLSSPLQKEILWITLGHYHQDLFMLHPPMEYNKSGLLTLKFFQFKRLCRFISTKSFLSHLNHLEKIGFLHYSLSEDKQVIKIILNTDAIMGC